jgi:hypothetical protein
MPPARWRRQLPTTSRSVGVMALERAPKDPIGSLQPDASVPGDITESEVWQVLGRTDVILRRVLEAHDRADRRGWKARVQAWPADLGQAWIRTRSATRRRQASGAPPR